MSIIIDIIGVAAIGLLGYYFVILMRGEKK
jgi:hypothetical protein